MIIAFDPVKGKANIKKHGYSLTLAEHLEWDTLWEREDNTLDYNENRYIGILYYALTQWVNIPFPAHPSTLLRTNGKGDV